MKELKIFGKNVGVEEIRSDKDLVEFRDGRIVVSTCERLATSLLKESLENLLYSQVCEIYEDIRNEGKIDLFGYLDFEILEKIDGRKERIAKLKGNRILVKLSAVTPPESALKYVIAHEIAHIFTKRHSKRFWRIVQTIYPSFKEGENLFAEYRSLLIEPLELE
jgi:hypothetical protein